MAIIPHPDVLFSHIRVNDIWLLLAVGGSYEFLCRLYLLFVKKKPTKLVQLEQERRVLQIQTDAKRKLGPSAFVETSKLERQLLAKEKEIESIQLTRKPNIARVEKTLVRYGNLQLAGLIFVLYYGVAVFTIDMTAANDASGITSEYFTKRMLFPISYVGMGAKIAKWGIENAESSMGALVVMWSAQVTVGKLFDAIDAYYL